jgi:hypothetical protein
MRMLIDSKEWYETSNWEKEIGRTSVQGGCEMFAQKLVGKLEVKTLL